MQGASYNADRMGVFMRKEQQRDLRWIYASDTQLLFFSALSRDWVIGQAIPTDETSGITYSTAAFIRSTSGNSAPCPNDAFAWKERIIQNMDGGTTTVWYPELPCGSTSCSTNDEGEETCSTVTCPVTVTAIQPPPAPPMPPAPPADPPRPLQPPSPPNFPGFDGYAWAHDTTDLRAKVEGATLASNVSIFLPEGKTFTLGGAPLVVDGFALVLASLGHGATIDGAHQSRLFVVHNGGSLVIENLRCVNGRASRGGGAIVTDNSVMSMIDARVSNCTAVDNLGVAYGGAVYVFDSVLLLSASIISDCIATSPADRAWGGALAVAQSQLVLTGTLIAGCHVVADDADSEGGGMDVSGCRVDATDTHIVRCSVTSSSDIARGGGLQALNSELSLTDCSITWNVADGGGGGYGGGTFTMNSFVDLYGTTVSDCQAANAGGGMYVVGGRVALWYGALLEGNGAASGSAMYPLAGVITYHLPAPPGHWLRSGQCVVYRKSCSVFGKTTSSEYISCINNIDVCSLDPDGSLHGSCPERDFVQARGSSGPSPHSHPLYSTAPPTPAALQLGRG